MSLAADPETDPSRDLRLFDSAADLMCVRDMQGRLVRVNAAWELTLGLSTDEVCNSPLLPLVHPADVPATLLHMTEADRCHQVVDFVNRYRRRDGQYRYLQWRAQRLGDVILGRARDVTASRQHDDEAERARQALEETLADLSSQVRTPSGEILTTVQALGQTELTPAQRAMVQALGRSVETLEDLVSQLVERERKAAWAAFLPTVERRRPAGDVRAARTITRGNSEPSVQAVPTTPDESASSLQGWIAAHAQHVDLHPDFHRDFRDLSSQALGLLAIRLGHLGQFYPRRLQRLSAGFGLMSAGRTAALLARMQDIGFVGVAGQFRAGQIRPYRVQAAMTQAFAGLLAINLQSLAASDYRAVLALEAIAADVARATPLLAAFAAALLENLGAGTSSLGDRLNGVPSMARGQAIALAIGADAAGRYGTEWEGWIAISLTSYAQRFEVSRVHVRRVIERLEPCGLLQDAASPSRLLVTRRFREEVDAYRQAWCDLLAGVLERMI